MDTRLKRFSGDFVRSTRPLLEPLETALAELSSPPFRNDLRGALPVLRDVSHQLDQLVEKVANLHAFVLIFGPLKSGKSTLMNAFAGAYVSEVSALPAYPCLVYVGHGEERSFEVTRYDGTVEPVRDSAALQQMVHRDHGRLAEALRAAEDRGEEFEPANLFPQAIRRIDVRLPAEGLAQSGAILVDTPGLYSRMKFGYDRMTRDFRNSAACAVFVVKTDNLFLEQVFDEFNELLDLFSRIFLVVNIDATKKDLSDDGELIPSLEQSDPRRIVSAFEDFAMSAPLKRAAEEGRLQIYPIDLLHAAQRRLKGEPAVGEAPPGSERVRSSFEDFQRDLTDFLNSAEYLIAFMTDSLHRGETLLGELRDVLENRREVNELRARLVEVEAAREAAEERLRTAKRLVEHDATDAFWALRERLRKELATRASQQSEPAVRELAAGLEGWFGDEGSLNDLVDGHTVPTLRRFSTELERLTREALAGEAAHEGAGLELPEALRGDLDAIGLDLGELSRQALSEVGALPPVGVGEVLSPEAIPVRRGLLDWLLLRSPATLRRRLFGAPLPDRKLTRAEKQNKLGERARGAMASAIDEKARRFVGEARHAVETHVVDRYVDRLTRILEEALGHKRDELALERDRREELARSHRRVLEILDQLAREATRSERQLGLLRREYLDTGIELQPTPRPDGAEGILEAPAEQPAPSPEAP